MSLTSKQTNLQQKPKSSSFRLQRLSYCMALALGAAYAPHATAADTFGDYPSCDATAYVTQGHVSRTYSVNLNTGDYQVVAEYHTNQVATANRHSKPASLDALGFNPNDGFIYGWSQYGKTPVRIHKDWSVEALNVETNKQKHFYAGDVSAPDNLLYLFSDNGKNSGLYSVNLDQSSDNYLNMNFLVSEKSLDIQIEDFAAHPYNGMLYAIDEKGNVLEIDPKAGSKTVLGHSGVSGKFGSAFFDNEGQFYFSRNHDGHVFRIAIDGGEHEAQYAFTGPSATTQDGFRCALAPATAVVAQVADFGDAPNSYGTSVDSDGARHTLSPENSLSLGNMVDGESDAYVFPLSDNEEGQDEDGVAFVTSFVAGKSARTIVESSGEGYLNVWVDANRDGVFDPQDHMVSDKKISAGDNMVMIPTPSSVSAGESWARFRLSSQQGVQATGLALDGEVEDHQVKLMSDPVTVSHYPTKTGWSTVAFEDNWPFVGDYDMNDLVMRLRTSVSKNSAGISQVEILGYITAAGASYSNGFGIRLPGIARDAIDESLLQFSTSDQASNAATVLEPGRNEAIFIITDNVFDHVTSGPSCDFYRSEYECGADLEYKFHLVVPFTEPQTVELSGVFDPFLFATPGEYHGEHFVNPPGRSYEIHLKNQSPTEAFDMSLFAGVGQDATSPGDGEYFLTETGMPWALEVGTDWRYPYEYVELSAAYPDFPAFATSSGEVNQDWYLESNASTDLIFPE